MYRFVFSFMFIGFWCVCGQRVLSPCPDYFDYKDDGIGVFGMINLQPFGPVSSLLVRANFTIAARLTSNYAGSIKPIGSEQHALEQFNRGVPLQYRVNFPVTFPLPKLTSLTVNDNIVCYGTGDIPKKTIEYPLTTSTPRLYTRPTAQKIQVASPRPAQTFKPAPNPLQTSSTSNSAECGITGNERIVPLIEKGFSYERGEWPWLVAIYKTQKFSSLNYICAGTLITNVHVISAAHCMQGKRSLTAVNNIIVKAGAYDLEDWSDDITVTSTIKAAAIHEAYNASTLANDILMMTLEKFVPFGTFIKPACLWSGNPDPNRIVGTSGVVAGWGSSELGPAGRGEPRMVRMPIVSTSTCRASKPEFHQYTSSKTLCAGDHNGSGPCLGDSGGGLYILNDGRWRLRGVVSLSLRSDNGDSACNLEEYVVFTDTAQYLPWINNVMSNSI